MNNSIGLMTLLAIAGFIPMIVILTTCFVKMSIVLIMARDSLGVQQVPPNMVLYLLSIVLSFYTMAPVYNKAVGNLLSLPKSSGLNYNQLSDQLVNSSSNVKMFLMKNTKKTEVIFFNNMLQKMWPEEMSKSVQPDDFIIIVPAFFVSELSAAFKIGFLIYIPSIIIDLIVSNLLMAMGMMMMSPVTISLPIKLLLFISLDGWNRLIKALFMSYKHTPYIS